MTVRIFTEDGYTLNSILDPIFHIGREIENVRRSHIQVRVQSISGVLNRTKFSATADIDFKIDLLNDSTAPSAELEAAYFYLTKGWEVTQDGRECSSTESDVQPFETRHFLVPPLRRMYKNSWAQLNFKARKVLAWSHKGDELKDYYRVSGRSLLRLVTGDGNFNYELQVDVTVEDIPF